MTYSGLFCMNSWAAVGLAGESGFGSPMILRKILKNANFQYFSDLLLFLLPYRVCERMNELRRLQNNCLNLQISPIDVDDT